MHCQWYWYLQFPFKNIQFYLKYKISKRIHLNVYRYIYIYIYTCSGIFFPTFGLELGVLLLDVLRRTSCVKSEACVSCDCKQLQFQFQDRDILLGIGYPVDHLESKKFQTEYGNEVTLFQLIDSLTMFAFVSLTLWSHSHTQVTPISHHKHSLYLLVIKLFWRLQFPF